jgi:hypothetical protein
MDEGKAMGQWAYYGLSSAEDTRKASLDQVKFIQGELFKRIKDEPFTPWGRKQANDWDKKTNFIYKTSTWEGFKAKADSCPLPLRNYALNRWFNFWSANGVENIFCSLPGVEPHHNQYDRLVDFTISGIPFDHKTTVFPKQYKEGYDFALSHPDSLIVWLYLNQSRQQRYHLGNRLFIVLWHNLGQHWKLRARLMDMRQVIQSYIESFDRGELVRLSIQGKDILSDIIWFSPE